ncbi:MAG: hypothetical protein LIP12_04105 [Clostridiales bacterium]|nr:hypothetical protein [Clostridiales bacterium]
MVRAVAREDQAADSEAAREDRAADLAAVREAADTEAALAHRRRAEVGADIRAEAVAALHFSAFWW